MQLGLLLLQQSDNDFLKASNAVAGKHFHQHCFAHGHIKKYPNLKEMASMNLFIS